MLPGCFHMGFNMGSNISEAVNFVTSDWVEYGKKYRHCSCGEKKKINIKVEQFYELGNVYPESGSN